MIDKIIEDKNILSTKLNDIAFAVNANGFNEDGFAGKVSKFWPELNNSTFEIGSSLSKKIGDKTFHALVCHSLDENGWGKDQAEIIKKCFDSINSENPIATVAIGTELMDRSSGANFQQIVYGMEMSNKKITLYGVTKARVAFLINEEKIRRGYFKD